MHTEQPGGVLLNTSAQLLLKAGVNAVSPFEFSRANIVPVGLQLMAQWPIIGGLSGISAFYPAND
ncbi:hypothetical protein BGZ96_002969 [Linnemannia gamsii]|uniref:Uncharacterized protein n=1 Tax=Linnemannia gamsii TaxID=64522 RepID=A0ABQ7KF63_9FUNG|nr:hypothetical protein BGZ96_002969 [Linnemannia gamsii]